MAAGRLAALGRSTARIGVRTLLVLVLLALAVFVARGYPQELIQRFGERGPAATLTDLTQVDQLQAAFDQADATPRLMLLLSPT